MRIGIEAQRLFRKKKHGMDIVALELIRALQKIDTENQYFIFVKSDEDNACIAETTNFKIVITHNSPYPWWEQIILPRLARQYKLDLLHCTSNTAPLFCSVTLVVTVHDIIYLEKLNLQKGSYYQIAGNLYRRWNVPRIIKKAKSIITVSEFERKNILTRFPSVNITTVYNGISQVFQPVKDDKQLQIVRDRYNLPEQFIFFLGNTDPKKNLTGVLTAFSLLIDKEPNKIPKLVMLDINKAYLSNVINKINPALHNHIITAGYVPNYELPAIYSLATLFLYPSLRESFGIPLLEAMACGAPVITSTTSSMPEIAGHAALLIDPQQPQQLADAIEKLIDNPELRTDLRTNGILQTKKFSWLENARQTLLIYNLVKKSFD